MQLLKRIKLTTLKIKPPLAFDTHTLSKSVNCRISNFCATMKDYFAL